LDSIPWRTLFPLVDSTVKVERGAVASYCLD
jgi:hypothetical protein